MSLSKSKTDNKPVNYHDVVERSRETFHTGETLPLEWKIEQLEQTIRMLMETTSKLVEVLAKNLYKNKFETFELEIDYSSQEIKYNLMTIKEWSATKKPQKAFFDRVRFAISKISKLKLTGQKSRTFCNPDAQKSNVE